jgi:hypothetical protein
VFLHDAAVLQFSTSLNDLLKIAFAMLRDAFVIMRALTFFESVRT